MAADRKWELTGELTEDGQFLVLDHWKMYKRLIKSLIGEKLSITFTKYKANRSGAQNRYIHGVVVPCVMAFLQETQGLNLDHDQTYAYLRTDILGHKFTIIEVLGRQVITMSGKRFSKMNTKEFAEAINEIIQIMDSRECYIPLPNEDNFIHQVIDVNKI